MYGTQGAFSHIASEALEDPFCSIELEHMRDNITYDEADGAYLINSDKELEVAKKTSVSCGVCDEQGASEFGQWFELGGQGFQRQP